MHWARGRDAAGRVLEGVAEAGMLHPRRTLGSDEAAGEAVDMAGLEPLPPVVPGAFYGLWNNSRAAAEKNGLSAPAHPLWFLKPPSALAGPGAQVAMPAGVKRVLFEGELGVVIGRDCRNVPEEEAAGVILGLTCVNDLTALDILTEDDSFPQWCRAKGFDGFGVIGPVVATGLDWRSLSVTVLVNGRERQAYACSDLFLGPEAAVAALSRDVTLRAGDVIALGTSLGARPLKAGDEVEVVIDGIGRVGVTMSAAEGGA